MPDARKKHPLFREEVDEMPTDKELRVELITRFVNLQRIKVATDRDKEIDVQLMELKAQLESLGVVTEDLTIR